MDSEEPLKLTRKQLLVKLLEKPVESLETSKDLDKILVYLLETPEELLIGKPKLRRKIHKYLMCLPPEVLKGKHSEDIRDFVINLTVLDAREDFYTYVKLIAENVIPNKFKDGRHIKVICKQLQKLYESYVRAQEDPENFKAERLQVFLPPRSMKSVLCSILFPSWILGRNPKYRILLIGNVTQNAIDNFGRPLKNLMSTPEYGAVFPEVKIDSEVRSSQRFNTTEGGGFYCSGGGVAIAGRGGDFIICDDLLSEQTAFSKTERTKINMNYVPGIRSRAQPGAAELIINTRWHLDDISGFTMGMDGYITREGVPSKKKAYRPWKIVSVPAILDEASSKLLREANDEPGLFQVGASYWPEYKPLDDLMDLRENYMATQPYKWNALYMQNPVPEEGNIVKRSDWSIWKNPSPPMVSQIIVSMDTAFGETQRADYSAYTVWGVFYKNVETLNNGIQGVPQIVLLYAERGKWDFHALCEKCEALRASKWKPDYFILEKKASGIVLAQELHRRSFPLIEYDPRGKKEERLQAAAVRMKTGQVWVPAENPNDPDSNVLMDFAEDVVEEVCNFPSAPNDDFTDTVSMAIVYLRDLGILRDETYDYEDPDDEGTEKFGGGYSYWNASKGLH